MKRKLHTLLLTALLCITGANAQDIIFQNPINGANPSQDNPFTQGQVVAPNVTATGIGRGPGLIPVQAGAGSYQGSGYNTPNVDPTAYFEFTITPDAGYAINYATLQFNTSYSGAPSITPFVIRSSADSYTANIPFSQASVFAACIVNLASFNEIEDSVTFRIYPFGSGNASDYFGLNTFTFYGTVTQVLSTPDYAQAGFTAYPNPVRDILTINAATAVEAVQVYNIAGALVKEKHFNTAESTIVDLSGLPAGMYLIRVQSGKNEKTLKVVKQ